MQRAPIGGGAPLETGWSFVWQIRAPTALLSPLRWRSSRFRWPPRRKCVNRHVN